MSATITVSPEDREVLTRLAESSPDANLRSTLRYALGMDQDDKCTITQIGDTFCREVSFDGRRLGLIISSVKFRAYRDVHTLTKIQLLAIAARME
jgi:hypothetical protein